MRVIVIGSGIAGLSAAIGLRKVGIDVALYERAPELREVGAGISLWANALRALEHLGAAESVRAVSLKMTFSEIRGRNGHRPLITLDAAGMERWSGLPELVRMCHRAELVSALAAHLPPGIAHYGHELVELTDFEGKPRVRFANGHTDTADAVVGADGIHSVVRTALFGPQPPRYSGYTAWRGICARPAGVEPGSVGEWWGRGKRVGVVTIPGDRVYWFAVENSPPNLRANDERAHLAKAFQGWAPPALELFAATPPDKVIRGDILDRKPTRVWSKEAVGVIGDAAHPTTPNLGQGGCMAIEDAVVLARYFAAAPDPATAWKAFTAERATRTASIVNESWRFGRIAQKEGRLTCWARDTAVGLFGPLTAPRALLKYSRFDTGPLPLRGNHKTQ